MGRIYIATIYSETNSIKAPEVIQLQSTVPAEYHLYVCHFLLQCLEA
jgi:hypothetical protein